MDDIKSLDDLVQQRLGTQTVLEAAVAKGIPLSRNAIDNLRTRKDERLLRISYQAVGAATEAETGLSNDVLSLALGENGIDLLLAAYGFHHQVPDEVLPRFDLARLGGDKQKIVPQAMVRSTRNLLEDYTHYIHPHTAITLRRFLLGGDIYIADAVREEVKKFIAQGIPPLYADHFLIPEIRATYKGQSSALAGADYLLKLFFAQHSQDFAGIHSAAQIGDVKNFRTYAMPDGTLNNRVRQEIDFHLNLPTTNRERIPYEKMIDILDRLVTALAPVHPQVYELGSYAVGKIPRPKPAFMIPAEKPTTLDIVQIPFWHAYYPKTDVEIIARDFAAAMDTMGRNSSHKTDFQKRLQLASLPVVFFQRFGALFLGYSETHTRFYR